jgi:hypothetical protein
LVLGLLALNPDYYGANLMSRTWKAACFALAALLVPVSAHGQDASVLVFLAAPPFVIALVSAAVIRHVWMRRIPGTRFSIRSGFALSALELFLWLLVAWFAAVVFFQEEWEATLVLVALLAGIVALNRRFGPPQRSWLFSVALAGVFPIAWFLVQLVWYGGFVLCDMFLLPA